MYTGYGLGRGKSGPGYENPFSSDHTTQPPGVGHSDPFPFTTFGGRPPPPLRVDTSNTKTQPFVPPFIPQGSRPSPLRHDSSLSIGTEPLLPPNSGGPPPTGAPARPLSPTPTSSHKTLDTRAERAANTANWVAGQAGQGSIPCNCCHGCRPHNCERPDFTLNNLGVVSLADKGVIERLDGKKKALCIGINYLGSDRQLRGCVPDVVNMREFLTNYCGFDVDDITLLVDYFPYEPPTKENILRHMKLLVRHAQPSDSLFLHYSGHGGQTMDYDGNEASGHDGVIFPVDHHLLQNGYITDDEMYRILVQESNLPPGSQLMAIFDSCHSGTVLDLPYVLNGEDERDETGNALLDAFGDIVKHYSLQHRDSIHPLLAENSGKVILWSGCKDEQTSADTVINGEAVGAMSHAFLDVLKNLQEMPTLNELITLIRKKIKENEKPEFKQQIPQLSTNHNLALMDDHLQL